MIRKKHDFPPRQVDLNRKLSFHWQQFIHEVQDAALKVALASEPIELSSDPIVALHDLMEHVQSCNSQSPHFPEIDCLPNHPDECRRCVAVRQAKRILEAHDESQRH